MNFDFLQNFKTNFVKQYFNDNYFICLYDKQDNYITSFENIEQSSKFFNMKQKNFLRALKKGVIEYNNQRCKLFVFKKDKEDDLDFGGKSL